MMGLGYIFNPHSKNFTKCSLCVCVCGVFKEVIPPGRAECEKCNGRENSKAKVLTDLTLEESEVQIYHRTPKRHESCFSVL